MSSELKLRRGTNAAHASFIGAQGEVTYNTDTKALHAHDNATPGGNPIGSFLQAGTGAVTRTAQAKMRDVVSVKDFGAVGDGVTNDTVAVQAAIAASANKTLIVPDGMTLYVTSQLSIASPMRIVMGAGSSFKSGYAPGLNTNALINITSSDVTLEDVVIDGQNNDHIGVLATSVNRIRIQGGLIKRCGILAHVRFETVAYSQIVGLRSEENLTNDGSVSLGAIYCNGSSRLIIKDCYITDFNGKGINLRSTSYSSVSDCFIGGVATEYADGIYLGYISSYISVSGCHVRNAGGNGVKISRGASRCSVTACSIDGATSAGSSGVLLQGAVFCSVSYCKISITGDRYAVQVQPHPDPEGSNSYGNVVSHNAIVSQTTTLPAILSDNNAVGFTNYDNEFSFNTISGGYVGIFAYTLRTKLIGNTILGVSNLAISVRWAAAQSDIIGNTLEGNTSTQTLWVNLSPAGTGVNISNNRIINSTYNGIVLAGVSRSNVSGNLIFGVGTAGTIGISVGSSVNDINIEGNYIHNFAVAGVYQTTTTATGINVSNNQFEACTGNAADVRASTGRVIGNIAKSSGAFFMPNVAALIHYGNSDKRVYVTTPDGTKQYAIAVDNAGAVTSTLV